MGLYVGDTKYKVMVGNQKADFLGKTIIWNQLIYNGNFAVGGDTPDGWGRAYVTLDNSDPNYIVFTSGNNFIYQMPYQSSFVLNTEHIYYICCVAKYGDGGNTTGYIYPSWALPSGKVYKFNQDRTWTAFGKVSNPSSTNNGTVSSYGIVRFFNSNSYITIDKNAGVQMFDLTLMFGAGNEPTQAEFDSMFGTPYIYHPFNLGELKYL